MEVDHARVPLVRSAVRLPRDLPPFAFPITDDDFPDRIRILLPVGGAALQGLRIHG
jgi:hypothetical protein